MKKNTPSVFKDNFVKKSAISTAVALIACLSTHLMTLFALSGAIAFMDKLEHALLFLTIGLLGLTLYAIIRHRRNAACQHE